MILDEWTSFTMPFYEHVAMGSVIIKADDFVG